MGIEITPPKRSEIVCVLLQTIETAENSARESDGKIHDPQWINEINCLKAALRIVRAASPAAIKSKEAA